ncbi:bifunctional tryptophan synthase trp1 [Puccinia graminis f. sp. tritici]|uniref:Multifunctional tryptophan biosynthesis protein n=1 Tax=Puccinia graminis f. sp. tritici TaxID=56615 RepID=A0A5B0RHU0_PUCGR|nr:bifunctional tryptophan synthase trp1 [Puccinia graminis f. sp. tritici]
MTKTSLLAGEVRVLIIDNYDSFTWNLYQYLCLLGASVSVIRSQACSLDELVASYPKLTHLVISPGPGHPSTDSGISIPAIHHYAGKIPILGICMGLQCIYSAFGGEVTKVGEIVHGKTSLVSHDGKGLFKALPAHIQCTRYHSLAGRFGTLPSELEVTCWTNSSAELANDPGPFDDQSSIIMGVRHKLLTIESVQYHPESILSEEGKPFLLNFLNLRGGHWSENPDFQVSPTPKSVPIASAESSSKQTILETICLQRAKDLIEAKCIPGLSPTDLKRKLAANVPPVQIDFYERIRRPTTGKVALMAEIKRASPSKGSFMTPTTPSSPAIAVSYAAAGASVISVLTEPKWFKGTLLDMLEVRLSVENVPNRPAILRKDFIIDPYQIDEARCYGADTILLIVACLSLDQLRLLYNHAKSLDMEPLVEVANAAELELALQIKARVIGVNNRNLHDFRVDMNTTSKMLDELNARSSAQNGSSNEIIMCALSGISSRSDVDRYAAEGVGAVLVGEALMKAEDKVAFVHELLGIPPTPKVTTRKPLVKICGIKTVEAAVHATNAGADLLGLIFVPKSKRCVTPQQADAIIKAVRKSSESSPKPSLETEEIDLDTTDWFSLQSSRLLQKRRTQGKPLIVGVFQNSSLSEIEKVLNQLGDSIDLIQLHGSEDFRMSKFLSKPVIKAFHIEVERGTTDAGEEVFQEGFRKTLSMINEPGFHSFSILDSSNLSQCGGTGQSFNWNAVKAVLASSATSSSTTHRNLVIAGGLNAQNVATCIQTFNPFILDICSGVEVENCQNGVVENKDFDKISQVIKLIKSDS